MHGLDLSFSAVADGPLHDLATAGDSAPLVEDLTVPADLATRPDLAGACPNNRTPTHVGDLAEGDLSDWAAEGLMPWMGPIPPTLKVEADNKAPARGLISVRLTCSTDQALLYYPRAKNAAWDLSGYSTLDFFVAADDTVKGKPAGWAETDPRVIIATSDGDQYVYAPNLNKLPDNPGTWISVSVPLSGGGAWTRTQTGNPSLANVNYVGFSMHSNGIGFKVWLDGVTFGPSTFVDCTP